ncbi:uncharacterized protein LOC107260928 [Ricinus communis]|uniref:uncharacterized protein LOC107260928 n=1 Tax=Ricinus communis TaxID=3988 RepID=UPI000772ADB4|nr:uncharacterized protein LOC107260928 [Ricinus communis]|eukprot:XP_015572306.1 uncharacterized protein LOC107260928 [Ricinus communis]
MGREISRPVRVRESRKRDESLLTRMVNAIFAFVKYAEFEIFFLFFFLVAFIIFKDLTSRPEYNQILVKKHGGVDFWAF